MSRASRLLMVALLVMAAVIHFETGRIAASAQSPYPISPTLRFDRARSHLLSTDAISWNTLPRSLVPVHFTFRRGETLASVLEGLGLTDEESYRAWLVASDITDLRKLRAGDGYSAFYQDQDLVGLHLSIRDEGRLELGWETGDWSARLRPYDRRVELESVRGELSGFLEGSIRAAGGDAGLAYVMADVLQWDLDFNRDLRDGDRFEVLYERIYLDQEFHDLGAVLALSYSSGDRRLTAYRFGDANAYYDADGRPLQKMFLRSPMRYSKVTSSFSHRRFHPVLKTYRPHYGVDYGAPSGTPVRVTANGVVASAAWDKGGGRVVKVRHANGYHTAYLHLSRFAKGIQSGVRVSQGEVIGYVGSSGLATAAHLDYRVQLGGRWVDPLSLKNDPAPPIEGSELRRFYAWRDSLDAGMRQDPPRLERLAASPRSNAEATVR